MVPPRLSQSLRVALALVGFGASLPVAAQTSPDPVDLARQAAQGDRNREAADLFAGVIQSAPERRRQLLLEYADQLTFSDRAAQAVPLYREALGWTNLSDDERQRANRGLALALAWSGQHAQAVAAYNDILARDPANRDARLNRARVQGWRNRYGAAEADYRVLLAANPLDREALQGLAELQSFRGMPRAAARTLGPVAEGESHPRTLFLLARAQHWSGRSDLAGATLARALALRPDDAEALRLQREIGLALSPLTEIIGRHSDQSDDTSIRALSLRQSFPLQGGAALFGAQYEIEQFDPDVGAKVTLHRPGLHAKALLSDELSVTAEGAYTIARYLGQSDGFIVGNVYGTITPSDELRFDFGVSRRSFDNVRSLILGIRSTEYGASVDIGSDAALKASLRGNLARISDGNERLWGQAELRHRLAWSPNWFVGLRYTRFGFSEILDSGYFNPKRLQSVEATTQLWGRLGRGYFDLRGGVGRENANPGSGKWVFSGEAKVTQPVSERVEV